jgi:hypothetical protein
MLACSMSQRQRSRYSMSPCFNREKRRSIAVVKQRKLALLADISVMMKIADLTICSFTKLPFVITHVSLILAG